MDSGQFDAIARSLGRRVPRRALVRNLIVAVAGLVGLRSADAAEPATLTIRNGWCRRAVETSAIPASCSDNGFGCTSFFVRGRTVATDADGLLRATVAPGPVTLVQQQRAVSRSRNIWVHCTTSRGRVLYTGRANRGAVAITLRSRQRVVCDWFNEVRSPLAFPDQCPSQPAPTTTTTTTTTTSTTTTTGIPCATDAGCPATGSVCRLPACIDGTCGWTPALFGTPCTGGGAYCDGLGACRSCSTDADCSNAFFTMLNRNGGDCTRDDFCRFSGNVTLGLEIPTCGDVRCGAGGACIYTDYGDDGQRCGPDDASYCVPFSYGVASPLYPLLCAECLDDSHCAAGEVCDFFECAPAST